MLGWSADGLEHAETQVGKFRVGYFSPQRRVNDLRRTCTHDDSGELARRIGVHSGRRCIHLIAGMVEVTTLENLTILGEPIGVLEFVFHITVPEKTFKSQRKFRQPHQPARRRAREICAKEKRRASKPGTMNCGSDLGMASNALGTALTHRRRQRWRQRAEASWMLVL